MYIRKIKIQTQDGLRRPTIEEVDKIASTITERLYQYQIGSNIWRVNSTQIKLVGCHLTSWYVSNFGGNMSPYNGRAPAKNSPILGWDDWICVWETVNKVLDEFNVYANVGALHGEIVIRTGNEHGDPDMYMYQNVGSYMFPVYRRDAWAPRYNGRSDFNKYMNMETREKYLNDLFEELKELIESGESITFKETTRFQFLRPRQDSIYAICEAAGRKRALKTLRRRFLTEVKTAEGLKILL